MPSRINVGPDGGPYIAINENSGDIELEDNSGNVVAKWDESATQWDFSSNDIQNVGLIDTSSVTTGSLDASSVTTGSLDAESATINGQPENDPRELINYVSVSGVSSISETISLDVLDEQYYLIEVLLFQDDETSANNDLELTVGGLGAGDYSYTLIDESATTSEVTGGDQYSLISPTASDSLDSHAGTWQLTTTTIGSRTDFTISPLTYGALVRGQGQYFYSKGGGVQTNDPFDLTFQASASGSDLTLRAAVFEVQDRSEI
jgi:hypothetical protein